MGMHVTRSASSRRRATIAATLLMTAISLAPPVWAQQVPPPAAPGPSAPAPGPAGAIPVSVSPSTTAGRVDNSAADAVTRQRLAAPGATPSASAPAQAKQSEKRIDLWQLAMDGGPLMIPIYAASVVVIGFAFERAFALRRRMLLPPELVTELGDVAKRAGGLDPRAVYRACLRYPSSASNILRAVLLKVGRPYAELETTLKELNEREAARLYKNVRPIELQISVAPLLGLLGTVQGMILAFFVTSSADAHVNKADELSKGIYMALVTTFAGLCVAIPAAVLAHYFEGRIQAFFRDLDELILGLLPNFERYEGKLRVNRQTLSGEPEHAEPATSGVAASGAPAERAPAKVPK
jgi:biopolymer transport protein ExbB